MSDVSFDDEKRSEKLLEQRKMLRYLRGHANWEIEGFKHEYRQVNWAIEKERREYLRSFYITVKLWRGQLPNLREILRAEEIDWLLLEAVRDNYKYEDKTGFVQFVARTGYKDEPKVDKDGKPLLNRTTPIHLAGRMTNYDYMVHVLFEIFNSDVNYIDELGMTHFHVACQTYCFDEMKKFLDLGHDPNCRPPPLHLAAAADQCMAINYLLKRGADPNLADAEGLTALHVICKRFTSGITSANILFRLSDEKNQLVNVSALDKFGRTPLHYALMITCYQKAIVRVLLDRDANPNLADIDGFTSLHLICQKKYDEDLVALFFKICDEKHHLAPIDPQDNRGRTPLYYAVANLFPINVDFLLNRGADLSKFVFPTESDFDEGIKVWLKQDGYKLRIASGAMGVVENLEKGGYKLDRSDALMIMKWYAKYGLFEKSEELEKCFEDEEFMNFARSKAKHMMIRTGVSPYDKCCVVDDDDEMASPRLSLCELIQLQPEEIEKLFSYWDYGHFAHTCSSMASRWGLADRAIQACVVHLCEMMSRRFFRRWAVYPFWDLIHRRLPLEVCEMIIVHLTNEDLYHICLAAQDQSS